MIVLVHAPRVERKRKVAVCSRHKEGAGLLLSSYG